ncbi:hypothetical protein AB5I41_07975 [Sphingomonas sp. MMS24-JH45]
MRFDHAEAADELSLAAERLQVARAKVGEVSSAAFATRPRRGASRSRRPNTASPTPNGATPATCSPAPASSRRATGGYTDRREWEGRAVDPGQPVMQVADPARVRYRIDLPTREHAARAGQRGVGLARQPAPVVRARASKPASYQPRPTADGTLAFALEAAPEGGDAPRIGSRGVARVRGPWAPLGYAMLKRPIASLRQYLGI